MGTKKMLDIESIINDIIFKHNMYEGSHEDKKAEFFFQEFFRNAKILKEELKKKDFEGAKKTADLVGALIFSIEKRICEKDYLII